MKNSTTLCVYCSSSDALEQQYYIEAEELGEKIALRDYKLIYGGGKIGLMGAVSRGVHRHNGHVTGVIPEKLMKQLYDGVDELVVTKSMRERKETMALRADAFIALPGGFGTLEEVLETITLKQLQYHNKPIVLLNTLGFYDHFLSFADYMVEKQFAKLANDVLYHIAHNVTDAMDYIASYRPVEFETKWF